MAESSISASLSTGELNDLADRLADHADGIVSVAAPVRWKMICKRGKTGGIQVD